MSAKPWIEGLESRKRVSTLRPGELGGRLFVEKASFMRSNLLRLACVLACALVFVPAGQAQGGPVTTFSGAASAVDIFSGFGPCTVAVAGSIDGSGAGGRGTFAATGDPPAFTDSSACFGGSG